MNPAFKGYERPDGSFGARNHVVVMPTVACANGVVSAVAREVEGIVPLYHAHGCGRGGRDLELHFRALAGLLANPNVAAAVVVGLGCEVVRAEFLAGAVAATGKPIECLEIQEAGGSRSAAEQASTAARRLLQDAGRALRTDGPLEKLLLGLKCGGSDSFSGVTANPLVGKVTDRVVAAGGTAAMTENTEMIGTTSILAERARSPEVAEAITDMVEAAERRTREIMGPLASLVIAPGNMEGGMSSIQEKSLGCIAKAGSSTIEQVVDYAQAPSSRGLVLMDGPGYDTESMTGLASAGAQAIIFTTGRGNPIGYPIVPVIKVASNSRLFASMREDMDFDAQAAMGRGEEDAADALEDLLVKTLEGEPTRAELNGQDGIVCLYTTDVAF